MLVLCAAAMAQTADAPPSRVVVEEEAEPLLNGRAVGHGAGVVLGYPTGLSYAYKPDQSRTAIQLGIGWAWKTTLRVHTDLLFDVYTLRDPGLLDWAFPFYVGIGGRVILGDDKVDTIASVGARVPLGMAVEPDKYPFDVFVELVPILQVWPETTVRADVAVGGRVYFF
jgi:hypothetical protein